MPITPSTSFSLYQVMQGMFANLPDNYSFHYNHLKFHDFFYRQRIAGNPLLQEVRFVWDSSIPESPEIDESLATFLTSQLVQSISPSFNPHIINSQAMRLGFDKYCKPAFNQQELFNLEFLAQEFQKAFPCVKF